MATKKHGISCYEKAAPDEPLFVLRAQDRLAPATIRMWARMAEENHVRHELVEEARRCADDMEKWPTRKMPD